MDESGLNLIDFKMLIDSADDGYMIADGTGKILYTNDAYLRTVAEDMETMVGFNIRKYIERGDIKTSSLLMALEQKKTVSFVTVIRNKQTAFVTSIPLFDETGNINKVLTYARDITEMNKMKKQIAELEEYTQKIQIEGEDYVDYGRGIVVVSSKMREVFELATKIKNVGTTVLLLGESGVGKDIVAQYIHRSSNLRDKPFIAINCSALSEALLESELFGYVGGSFTGASKGGKQGLFEAAQNGILFLDEIGDISLGLQVKLLRAIETKTITRVGDYKSIPVNVRIITATNKNLPEMVKNKTFREDLYYRLNVISISISPLRMRKSDIAPLSLFYLNRYNQRYNLAKSISKEAIHILEEYKWPGNVRELKNIIERLVVTSEDELIDSPDLSFIVYGETSLNETGGAAHVTINNLMPLEEAVASVEKQILVRAKQEFRTSRKMAEVLKVSRATVSRKLNHYNISAE